MKKQVLTTLGIAAIGMASYAASYMRVKTADGKITRYEVKDVIEVDFEDEEISSDTIIKDTTSVSTHEYVDLDLPSGILWATYNVGATTSDEFGDYFAWGETEPKKVYDWSTYKYAKASWIEEDKEQYWKLDTITKYHLDNEAYPGSKDGLTTLLAEDDAATANWGDGWRMPTSDEIQELVNNREYKFTEVNGVSGAKFTAKNGNSIFFPIGGFRNDSVFVGKDGQIKLCYYWSSSLRELRESGANALYLYGSNVKADFYYRVAGASVRAVRERKMFSVKFYSSDSILIETQNVAEGRSAKEVKVPTKKGYVFVGWNAAVNNITSDISVYAIYELPSYVDLELPSGTLWANYNIGASKTEEYGDYFAWGETETKEMYGSSTYKWESSDPTKYNKKDGLTILLAEDDAATANWGDEWRMPNLDEIEELVENCQYSWTEINGIYGAKFTANNGKYVFFPAAGKMDKSKVYAEGNGGLYWSSSLNTKAMDYGKCLYFVEENPSVLTDTRHAGASVRAVRANK